MKSFLYTVAVLFGALTVAQAAAEQKQPAEEAAVVIEEVSAPADAPAADAAEAKKEETK